LPASTQRLESRWIGIRCCDSGPTLEEQFQRLLDAPLIDPLTDSMDEPEALRW